jgi:hypothetical protein
VPVPQLDRWITAAPMPINDRERRQINMVKEACKYFLLRLIACIYRQNADLVYLQFYPKPDHLLAHPRLGAPTAARPALADGPHRARR